MKMAVFFVVVLKSLSEIYRRFRGDYFFHQGDHNPDDGGSKDLRNVGKLLILHSATNQKTAIFILSAVKT
jgi:hypothetical protein